MSFSRGSRVTLTACWLLVLLPVLFSAGLLARYGVEAPFWDDWSLAGHLESIQKGEWTPGRLLAQHNEHRPAVPIGLQILAARIWGWQFRAMMWVTQALLFAMFLGLVMLWRRAAGPPRAWTVAALALVSFLLYWPAQYQNTLWAFQICFFLPAACLLAVVVVASPPVARLGVALTMSAICCAIASFSVFAGLFTWPIAGVATLAAYGRPSRKDWWTWAAWGLACVAVLAAYFHGYHEPPGGPSPVAALKQPLALLTAFATCIGSPFGVGPYRFAIARGVGFVAIAVLFLLAIGVWKRRTDRALLLGVIPWMAMGAYGLLTAAAIAAGRMAYGDHALFESRYATIVAWIFMAIVMLATALRNRAEQQETRVAASRWFWRAVAVVLVTLGIFSQPQQLQAVRQHAQVRRQARALLMLGATARSGWPTVPREYDWTYVWTITRVMRSGGWLPQPPAAPAWMADDPRTTDCAHGAVEAMIATGTRVMASGWAYLPEGGRPADAILGTTGAPPRQIFLTTPTTGRLDVVQRFQTEDAMISSWFVDLPSTLLSDEIDIWAFDVDHIRAYRLCRLDAQRANAR